MRVHAPSETLTYSLMQQRVLAYGHILVRDKLGPYGTCVADASELDEVAWNWGNGIAQCGERECGGHLQGLPDMLFHYRRRCTVRVMRKQLIKIPGHKKCAI